MNTLSDKNGTEFRIQVEARLNALEDDLTLLEAENTRLRKNTESTYFERDACVGLILQMATRLGLTAGRTTRETAAGTEQLVVLDLPAGQVCWEYMPAEAHLFAALPPYTGSVAEQTPAEIYTTVMNPGF